MRCSNMEDAKRQAQANADQTGVAWCAFFDTSGNAHAERWTSRERPHGEYRFDPSDASTLRRLNWR